MKMSTKTIASLMVVTAVASAMPGASQLGVSRQRRKSQFDKLLAVHDRKGELRAEILGISALTFRQMSRTRSFAQIVRECGIGSTRAFRLALFGRLRDELLRRGWSRAKIDAYMTARAVRVAA